MSRAVLLALSSLFVALIAAPRTAHADDRVPCSDEADAVKKMKTRDPALAYPKNAGAKAHLETGKRAFGVQQYDKAIDEYTAAGLDDDAPLILYNLGQTYRAAKEYEKAIPQYELFLERGKPGTEVRALVECQIATMKAELDHAASTAPPRGPASDQTAPSVPSPSSAPPDRDDELTVAPRSRWTGTRKVAAGVGLVSVGGLVAGAVFAIQTQSFKDDAARLCPSSPCSNADQANALTDRAGTRATMANISFGVGAGFVVGAVVLWYLGAPSASRSGSADAAGLVPKISPTFAGIAYGGTF